MPDYTASVDAGNGGVNAVIATSTKTGFKSYYEPSVRAAATGDSLGLGSQWEMDFNYFDWNGHRYVSGDQVLHIRRGIERHMGANRYGNEFHQMLVAKALAELGVKSGEVDLTVFAPPGLYVEQSATMKERFTEDGDVKITLKGDKKPRIWRYNNITVFPEGIGAAACFVIDEKGEYIASDVLNGDVLILDIGAHTLDALKLVDGNFNPEMLQFATWESAGVDTHIRQPILQQVKKLSPEFARLTVDDIDRVIRLGSVTGDYTLTVAGLEVDLDPLIKKYSTAYAGWIANNIIDGAFDQLRGIRAGILVGGGAYLTEDFLTDQYPDKFLNRKDFSQTKKVAPEDMNAVGGLRLAKMRQNSG